jgi:hypothetical protein
MIRHLLNIVGLLFVAILLSPGEVDAQDRYFPLHHRQPTGMAGRWSLLTHPQKHGAMQPVRVSLPSTGHVSFYSGSPQNRILTQAPSDVRMSVGHVYRFQVSGMPEFPGVELYPTVEILDRLHPPEGHAHEFPIPVELTEQEIETVLQDRMVTKVIYLEQPDLAHPADQENGIHVEDLPVGINLLKAADLRGRPMAILRIGGRTPDPRAPTDEFYSRSPIVVPPQ